ncbi:MAG: hypothetical protein K6F64_01615 [Clostridia bacterium]|nr:hypothetical protein [Clostridia bacterium]
MKTAKKLSAIFMVIVIIACSASVMASAKKLNYLLLGDSIAFGQGILNSGEACYGRIVANSNGYGYDNDAISGMSSAAFLTQLSSGNIDADIKKADIISISIGGNDYLTRNWVLMGLKGMFFNNYADFDEVMNGFANNFSSIIGKIRSLNPKATILMQTVYNPHSDNLAEMFQQGVDRLNKVIRDYLKAHSGAYIIADVGSVISGHSEYIAIDTIHPNGAGNIAIATYLLKLLKGLGLGSASTPVISVEPVDTVGFGADYFTRLYSFILRFAARVAEVF